ncbi:MULTISPECIES: DUF6988 family protein [unclassified Arsukibacterium]|uniref:DUF6988 family protein n=1 Tax=unclassified Arsukibacterium TaxID=2635278 RepID=UPI000E839A5E|nr:MULTISPECIES: hypothetical protein [unclassified Arsukibacterium]HAW93051.1 hypothetical protein [Candidatus Azambacteria bacterium]
MYKKELETLLPRCFEMYDFMAEHINHLQHYELLPDLKFRMAFQSGILSFEHGLATLKLIADGFVSSGLALMRPQYESLVRGFWFMHADTDNWIAKLRTAGQVGPNELSKLETPMISDMLKLLDQSDAPNHILKQLQDFKAISNSTLNSFTHCGLIALVNNGMGYDQKLIYDALRNCNAVAAINLQMLSILTGDEEAITPVRNMHHQFHDCLPIVHA